MQFNTDVKKQAQEVILPKKGIEANSFCQLLVQTSTYICDYF